MTQEKRKVIDWVWESFWKVSVLSFLSLHRALIAGPRPAFLGDTVRARLILSVLSLWQLL